MLRYSFFKKGIFMSYSDDFREIVLLNISRGMSWDKACEVFSISRRSISNWIKNKKERGVVSDAPRKAYKTRKIDPVLLQKAVAENPDATLEEIAQKFDCWPQSIHKRCVKLGLTRKKNQTICGTG